MRSFIFITILTLYVALDFYVFFNIRGLWEGSSLLLKRGMTIGYWTLSLVPLAAVFFLQDPESEAMRTIRTFVFTGVFILFFAKVFASLFLFFDDIRRGFQWIVELFPTDQHFDKSRSEFIRKSSVVAAAVPVATMSFGIISGAHDYRVRNRTLTFPNLPKEFDGIRILQVSDIHTGSFFNKTAVMGGMDMINAEKPDVFFFTGDLVNDHSEEAKEYLDIFNKVKASLGTFSIMGNHDYGDYRHWNSLQAKQADIKNLHDMHGYMGWDLLLNENRSIKVDGAEIGILGIENWGEGRFSKYGNMAQTYSGSEEKEFKILLSHDPSHWDAQVRPDYSDIDLTLSGHTHGFQFGVEIGSFKWSPSQYIYKRWADH